MEKVETQQSLKLDPRGQADRSRPGPLQGRGEKGGAEKGGESQWPGRSLWRVRTKWPSVTFPEGQREWSLPTNTPLDGPESVLLAIRPLLTVTNSDVWG